MGLQMHRRITFLAALLAVLAMGFLALGCGDTGSTDASKDDVAKKTSGPGPLALSLQKMALEMADKIPPEVQTLLEKAGKELRDAKIVEKATNVGGKAPDVGLKDPAGGSISLAALRKEGPVVVAFYRGKW